MILQEIEWRLFLARGAGLANLVVDAWTIQVIVGRAVAVDVSDNVLTVVDEIRRDGGASALCALNATTEGIVFVNHVPTRGRDDLGQAILEVPGGVRRACAFALRRRVAVAVVQVRGRAGCVETIERLIGVRGA